MTITINGELSPSEFLDLAQYFKENELDILTLKEPLYVCGAKISRVNNKIIIDALQRIKKSNKFEKIRR